MRNSKRVLSKAQILDRVWSYDFGGRSNIVELYVSVPAQEDRHRARADDPHLARGRAMSSSPRAERGPQPLPLAADLVTAGPAAGLPDRSACPGVRGDRRRAPSLRCNAF